MELKFDNNSPIYMQLVDQLKISIISGDYQPGEKLPSVREFSLQTKVNPNTMQKALAELQNQKLIYTERTSGKFVTEDKELILSIRKEYAKALSSNYCLSMGKIGYNKEEIVQILTSVGGEN